MSSLDSFEGIDDLDDQKQELEDQDRQNNSEEEDNDDEQDDDDLTPPARPQETAYEKAILQLTSSLGARSARQSSRDQTKETQDASTASTSISLPVVSRQRQGSIDSSDRGQISGSPSYRLPVLGASSGSPTTSASAAAIAARIVTARARTSSNPSVRPGSWTSISPTQSQFSPASPTSSYATHSTSSYPEPPGAGQSPSNKSDFATYMQQSQGSRRLSLDRRHSYSASRLSNPSPGEFTAASPSSPALPDSISSTAEGSPSLRPIDADEAWVDLTNPDSSLRALEAASGSNQSTHARTVSDPFPGLYGTQGLQQHESAVQILDSLPIPSSDPSYAPDAATSPPTSSSSIITSGSASTPLKPRRMSMGVQDAGSPHRSSSPVTDYSSMRQATESVSLPTPSAGRASASPRGIPISRPSLLRQHSSPTKSMSSSRSSRSTELKSISELSFSERMASGHHRRSPSLGGHSGSIRSPSPLGVSMSRLASVTGVPDSISGIADASSIQMPWDTQANLALPPGPSSPKSLGESANTPSALEPSPSIGLALSSLQSFKFGGASPSLQELRNRTPSPPFLPSARAIPSLESPMSTTVADGPEEEPMRSTSRPSGNPDLALPPPSGYELSDDLALDISPFDEHSDDTDMFGPLPGGPAPYHTLADLPTVTEDITSPHTLRSQLSLEAQEAPPSPLMSSIPLPLFDVAERSPSQAHVKSPDWGVALDYDKRGPLDTDRQEDKESRSLLPHDAESAIDEEALTPLERIFLFAKSEVVEHRETVSRALPRWISGVEICEAVDYVLPLFEGLACDEDTVKEAFAASLDSLIYHFLINCPLQELDASHQIARLDDSPARVESLEARLDEAAEAGIPTSLVVTQRGLEIVDAPESISFNDESGRQQELLQARQGWPDDSKTITPGTGSTMRSSEDGTATDLLSGDLAKEQTELVARPHISFTQFYEIFGLLLLNDNSVISSLAQEAIARLMLRINGQPVPSSEADMQADGAAELLDSLQPEVASVRTHDHSPYEFSAEARLIVKRDILGNVIGAIANIDASSPPQLAKLLGGRSSAGTSQVQTPASDIKDTDDAVQISSFFSSTSSPRPSQHGSETVLDARQGRFVALSCVNLLIDFGAVSAPHQSEYLLPIAITAARDSDPMIRMAAVDALAGLAKLADQTELAEQILPAFEASSKDENVQVRRAVCGTFQEVVQALHDKAVLRRITVNIASALYHDEVAQVRQGILEVIGPLIHLFAGDVPEELMLIFEGSDSSKDTQSSTEQRSSESPLPFQPLVPAFAVPDRAETEEKTINTGWDVSKDHERAIITAYNLPGVLLSLGSKGWPRLRSLHKRLATDAITSQARYLVASSIHDVAKIIGPEDATADLLPMLPTLAKDDDLEVIDRLFERLGPLVDCLSSEGLPTYIRSLCDWWDNTTRRNWHRRELLAEAIWQLSTRLDDNHGLFPAFTYLLKQILRDNVACVRTWGMKTLAVAMACRDPDLVDQLRDIWEGLAADSHHKYRSLSANAVAAVSSTVALEQPFLLDLLVKLASDPIPDVRIGVARALRFLCMTGGPYDLERPPRMQAALVRLATNDNTASVRELLVDVRLDPLPDDFGPDDMAEDASFSSSDEEDASDRARGILPSGRTSRSRPIPSAQTSASQNDMSPSVASPPVDTWNLADLASPQSKDFGSNYTNYTQGDSYTSLESLLPQQSRGLFGSPFSLQRGSFNSTDSLSSGRCNTSFTSRLWTPSIPSSSSLLYDTQETPGPQAWQLSTRDVDQYVAIDLAV